MTSTRSHLARLAIATLPCCACDAWSAGFQLSEQSAGGLGSAFAGQAAVAEDASVVYFNPANMTRLTPGRHATFAVYAVKPKSHFSDEGSCAPYVGTGAGTTACPFGSSGNLGHTGGGDGGPSSDVEPLANLYLAWQLSERWWAGVGLTGSFGLETRRDADWVGRFKAIDSQTRALDFNPALAFRATESLSLAGGVVVRRFDAKLSNAISYRAAALGSMNAALIAAVPPGAEGVVTVRGKDYGYGWNIGAQQRLTDDWQVAIAYRSSIRHRLAGTVEFANRPAAFAQAPVFANGAVRADARLPDTLSVASAWAPTPSLTLMADWTRTGWESIQDLVVVRDDASAQILSRTPLRLGSSWRAGIGGSMRLDPAFTVRLGYARETSPVHDEFRSPRLPDSPRNILAGGLRWTPSPGWSVDVGGMYIKPSSARVRLANQDQPGTLPTGSLVGRYDSRALVAGVQVNRTFGAD